MNRLLLRNVLLSCVCVLAASASAQAQGSGSAKKPAESPDASFVQKAAEADLSELAQDHASSPKVREFAQRMVRDHGRNSQDLAIIASRENLALPDAVNEEHAQLLDALSGERGATFDNDYMTVMLKDHRQMASLLKSSEAAISTDELRTFIKKTLPVVEHHAQMAQDIQVE